MPEKKLPGKKYLLYIHHHLFSVEKYKSALVERLLREHYNPPTSGNVYTLDQPKKPKMNGHHPDMIIVDDLQTDEVCEHGRERNLCPNILCPYNPNN